jgi:hypothetical protein
MGNLRAQIWNRYSATIPNLKCYFLYVTITLQTTDVRKVWNQWEFYLLLHYMLYMFTPTL